MKITKIIKILTFPIRFHEICLPRRNYVLAKVWFSKVFVFFYRIFIFLFDCLPTVCREIDVWWIASAEKMQIPRKQSILKRWMRPEGLWIDEIICDLPGLARTHFMVQYSLANRSEVVFPELPVLRRTRFSQFWEKELIWKFRGGVCFFFPSDNRTVTHRNRV